MSRRTTIVMTVAFVLALCAGVAVGMLGARIPERRGEPRSWLVDELQLSSDQREKMKAIWSDVSKGRDEHGDKRRDIEKQRGEELMALLTDQQRADYEEINKKYSQKMQDLSRERDAKFKEGERLTEEMLTPEQREKYKALRERRRDGRGGDRGPGPGGDRGSDGPRRGRRGGGGGAGMPTLPSTEPASRPAP